MLISLPINVDQNPWEPQPVISFWRKFSGYVIVYDGKDHLSILYSRRWCLTSDQISRTQRRTLGFLSNVYLCRYPFFPLVPAILTMLTVECLYFFSRVLLLETCTHFSLLKTCSPRQIIIFALFLFFLSDLFYVDNLPCVSFFLHFNNGGFSTREVIVTLNLCIPQSFALICDLVIPRLCFLKSVVVIDFPVNNSCLVVMSSFVLRLWQFQKYTMYATVSLFSSLILYFVAFNCIVVSALPIVRLTDFPFTQKVPEIRFI